MASSRHGNVAVITKEERRYAMAQALANTRLAGHQPSQVFLVDVTAVVEGAMSYDDAIRASAARARGSDKSPPPRWLAPGELTAGTGTGGPIPRAISSRSVRPNASRT